MTTLAAEVSVSTGCTPNETTPVTSTGLGIRSVRGIGYLQVLDNKNNGGERGIRTPDTRKGIHAFEARAFSHSAISPRPPVSVLFYQGSCRHRVCLSPSYPCNACHSDPRAEARGGGTCFFSVLCIKYSILDTRYCFCPAVNTVQGPAFMSCSSGFCQANSG